MEDMAVKWKKLNLYGDGKQKAESRQAGQVGQVKQAEQVGQAGQAGQAGQVGQIEQVEQAEQRGASSAYLLARDARAEERQKNLLYDVLGPVFFGEKQAESQEELAALFCRRYGIDVQKDFYEGDEHYEEYLEAQQAIAEGMSIYGGAIAFDDCVLAELAERIWEKMEQAEGDKFRRINTALEE